ncbi:MAG: four helix bundle protein [Cyclobacteriaceae bacterium]|nr:four helix bundle protein [Cyclobacteriaceae bacterium]
MPASYQLEDLNVWKLTRNFRKKISVLTKTFPGCEKYLLSVQLIRSSRSVTANIAEGFGRFHYKENIQFCRQARGSLFEILDHLYVALDEEYISLESFNSTKNDVLICLKLINGYICFLKKKKNLADNSQNSN